MEKSERWKPEITKIVVKLGDKPTELTIDQAKALRDALNELFGKDVIVKEEHHHHHHDWPWYWNRPIYTYQPALQQPAFPTPQWQITCQSDKQTVECSIT